MAALVAQDGTAGRVELQSGLNTIGRGDANQHVIADASVSTHHCEVVCSDGTIGFRDLGSTNGSYLNGQPVQEASLSHGDRLRLGNVEFAFDAPEVVPPKPAPLRAIVVKHERSTQPSIAGQSAAQAVASVLPMVHEPRSFYAQLPGAFVYPLRRNGLILLILGSVLFAILGFLSGFGGPGRGGIFSLLVTVFSTGYLFAYMQRMIAHTAQGDDELPDFPDVTEWWADILYPFFLFLGCFLVSFAPAILAGIATAGSDYAALAVLTMVALGALYLPMALLAVAVSDNFIALSPHIVLPSIFRVFVPYLVTLVFLAFLVGIGFALDTAEDLVPISQVLLKIGATFMAAFVSLYLLSVKMRVLGLLFRSYRARLGWLG